MKLTRFRLLLLTAILLAAAPDAPAQAQKKKRTADPEGQPVRKAVPESVKVERDIVYATYGERKVMLDLYLPKKPASEKIPCIVVIHGGGWRSGDKTRFAAQAAALAEQGFATACIGYRLLPEVEFPAPIVDCKAAVRWVRANAAKHGIDPDRLGAIGGSAGGHLVAMLGTSAGVKELEADGGNAGVSSRVQAVVAMATPADMSKFGERTKVDAKLIALISPVTHVSKDSAPVLLLHGTKDTVVPMAQSELLLEKYKAAGASAELVKMEGGPHAFWNATHFDETMKLSVKFFRKQLGGAKDSQ
ncbi:MAG: alpha/beta hydrolase [Verrucomicrobia bacterium]|nr:alpha/beta hydrolase [Verrucomicrobiota bacterium]